MVTKGTTNPDTAVHNQMSAGSIHPSPTNITARKARTGNQWQFS